MKAPSFPSITDYGCARVRRAEGDVPPSIEPDALRLVIGLLVAGLFVGFAVLISASLVALSTYLAAVLGTLAALAFVLLWPDRPASNRGKGKPRTRRGDARATRH